MTVLDNVNINHKLVIERDSSYLWGPTREGVPVPLLFWNKLACSPVPQKSNLFSYSLFPNFGFVPLFPSKVDFCSPVALK